MATVWTTGATLGIKVNQYCDSATLHRVDVLFLGVLNALDMNSPTAGAPGTLSRRRSRMFSPPSTAGPAPIIVVQSPDGETQ